ncbi:MAG: glycine cleavage system protein GcvH [Clostridia bacterium]|nr:glycine cleavage system protein GcvH [Clostridia bacterium]MBR5265934.1 glycine cleavage system protein GcvH [Clostridia bacterium]
MNIPTNLMYSKDHEWVKMLNDGTALVGITDHAQSELGDIVFINLPVVGDEVVMDEPLGDVESVKAVSDIICPISGTVAEINEELLTAPQAINEDAYEAWLIRVENVTDKADLLTAEEYAEFVEAEK